MNYWKLLGCGFVTFFCASTLWAQQEMAIEEKDEMVKYTVIGRFEPELALTVEEREQLKRERFMEIDSKLRMLDTMDLSERKRERLMQALVEDPFSPRLDKIFADIEFEKGNK